MQDIPFSFLWGCWNSGKGLFLECLYLRCLWTGAHAAWAARPNLETYKVEVLKGISGQSDTQSVSVKQDGKGNIYESSQPIQYSTQ